MKRTPDTHLIDASDQLMAIKYRLAYLMGTMVDDDSLNGLYFTLLSLHDDIGAVARDVAIAMQQGG